MTHTPPNRSKHGYIDKVVVREQIGRMTSFQRKIATATHAAKALNWFTEYGIHSQPPNQPVKEDILNFTVYVKASATVGSSEANDYLQQAAARFHDDIVKEAIRLAEYDFNQVPKSLKHEDQE